MGKYMFNSDFERLVEAAMDKMASWPARLRRKLLHERAPGWEQGHRGVVILHEGYDDPEAIAAAAFEPGGVWRLGTNFNAAPVPCQDCGLANWDGDRIVGCSWVIDVPRKTRIQDGYAGSYEQRLAFQRRWEERWKDTWPEAFLAYCRSKGAIQEDGTIDIDRIYKQCAKCQPLEEDE